MSLVSSPCISCKQSMTKKYEFSRIGDLNLICNECFKHMLPEIAIMSSVKMEFTNPEFSHYRICNECLKNLEINHKQENHKSIDLI